MENNVEQIRQLENSIHFAGKLAELEDVRHGTTQAGIPYLSFRGAVQCGEDPVYTVKFRTFVKSKKRDGSDSENYKSIEKWVEKAVPMTKDKENATMFDGLGSVTDNPYVNASNELKETVQFNLQKFDNFRDYAAEINLEGFIHSFIDETHGVDGDELTGRQRMRLISRDIYGNTLDIKNIIIPPEYVDPLREGGYERGCTTTFFVNLVPNSKPVASGGIGHQRVTNGQSYLEWVMTGAAVIIPAENEKALSPALIKNAMNERKTRLKNIKDEGYQGGSSNSSSTTRKAAVGNAPVSTNTKTTAGSAPSITEDDDFPF